MMIYHPKSNNINPHKLEDRVSKKLYPGLYFEGGGRCVRLIDYGGPYLFGLGQNIKYITWYKL